MLSGAKAGVVGHFGGVDDLLGVYFSSSLAYGDRVSLRLDDGFLLPLSPSAQSFTDVRVFYNLMLGYRVLLAARPRAYVTPFVGAGLDLDFLHDRTYQLQPTDPTCVGAGCAQTVTVRDDRHRVERGLLIGDLSLQIGRYEFSYAARVDPSRGGHVFHQFLLGLGTP